MESLLSVAKVHGRSVVVGARAHSPLRLLEPRNHGEAAWVYQSSHGGGFVGADQVALEVDVQRHSTLFLSTQAATKVYRGARSRFSLTAALGPGASLASWPDPVACFPGAAFTQTQAFQLAPDANLLAVDAFTAGRVACGERWAFERLDARLTVDVDGERRFRDRLLLSPAHGELAARLAHVEAIATVILAGPRLRLFCAALLPRIAELPLRRIADAPLVVASPWPWGLVLRASAPDVEALTATLRALLREPLQELLRDDPFARKW